VSEINFYELTSQAKKLVRKGKYRITYHVMVDHPERNITAADILECLKIGSAVSLEPRKGEDQEKYWGADRYRWFGQDSQDRVLRLIVSIQTNVIVISAAEATRIQRERYLEEDEEGLLKSSGDEDERK
jgi:hypothetical protein